MLKLNRFLAMIITLVMIIGLAGCAPGSDVTDVDVSEEKETGTVREDSTEVSDGVPDYLNKEGFPIVKKPITLTAMVYRTSAQPPWKDILAWQEYEKMTGIKIEWEELTSEVTEKRNLALASGEYPDLFYRAEVTDIELIKYGVQGVFITLNDLIEEYAPNFKALAEKYPSLLKTARMPDGNIYSFVQFTDSDPVRINPKLYINRTWLDRIGKEMPTTTDELYELFKAFRDEDPNNNDKPDEIPWTSQSLGHVQNSLYGAFGLRNRGSSHPIVDMDEETGKLRFIPIQDEFKEMLQFLNKLYTEKLLDQEIFTMNVAQMVGKASQDLVGAFCHTNAQQIGVSNQDDFEGIHVALKGPRGHQLWSGKRGHVGGRAAFVITDKCKYPEAAVRWMDYFYSDEGSKLIYLGVEGKSYEKTADGEYNFLSEIVDNIPEGSTFDQVISHYVPYAGGGLPGLQKTEFFKGGETQPIGLKAGINMASFTPKEVWEKFSYTLDEIDEMGAIESDIIGYVNQMVPQFIQGKISFSEWDNYVSAITKMNLERYMEIYTKAHERYIAE